MKKLMAIAAHPDDIEFGCSIAIYNFIQQGYNAVYVIVTDGESGFKIAHKPGKERIKIREKEQIEAAKEIGANKVIFLKEKDGNLQNNIKLRAKLVKLIKQYKPEIVFSFDPANKDFINLNLNHPDHRNLGEAVFDAVFAAKNKYLFSGEQHKVDKIYFFGASKPNYFVDITKKFNLKLKALSKHESQFTDFKKVEKFLRWFLSRYTKKYKYSEAFRIVNVLQIT